MKKENDFDNKDKNPETENKDSKKKLTENWKLWGIIIFMTGAWRIPFLIFNSSKLALCTVAACIVGSVGLLIILKLFSMKYGKEKELKTLYSNNSFFAQYLSRVNDIIKKLTGYSFM